MDTGPPSPPQGPLDVMDIYSDRCALLWDTPKEDGGAPITHYIVEKCDQEKGEWEKVCETDDLEIDVSDLTPGHKYQFRVAAVNSEGQSEFLSTDGAILAKDPWGRNWIWSFCWVFFVVVFVLIFTFYPFIAFHFMCFLSHRVYSHWILHPIIYCEFVFVIKIPSFI